MREESIILTKVTKEVTGNLPGGETVRCSGTYEPGKELDSVRVAAMREGRQIPTASHQREGQVGYNFSAGNDFKTTETVIDEVLPDIDDFYDKTGSESVRLTIENGIITGASND